MEVILKEDVPKLGNRGDVVKVAEGYGRNFLLPRKLAIEATAANKAVIEQMKAAAVRRSAKEKVRRRSPGQAVRRTRVKFQRKSGENDQLFGSVTSGDVADALEKKSFTHRPPQDPVARAAENDRRVYRSDQAAQGRHHAPESDHREGSGGVGVVKFFTTEDTENTEVSRTSEDACLAPRGKEVDPPLLAFCS